MARDALGSTARGTAISKAATGRVARQPLARPTPLREQVYEAIAEMIVSRELSPGEHLVENELATHLGVSRQPVREALQRLETEGWVDLRPAHGAFVHIPTDEETSQLLAVRTLLEVESARLAAANATEDELELLHEAQRTGEKALAEGDKDGMVTANFVLHSHVVAMSGNAVLADLISSVDRRVRWYYPPIARLRGDGSWEEHAQLIDAIAAGDATRAADLMRQHTERTREMYHQWREEKPEGEE